MLALPIVVREVVVRIVLDKMVETPAGEEAEMVRCLLRRVMQAPLEDREEVLNALAAEAEVLVI